MKLIILNLMLISSAIFAESIDVTKLYVSTYSSVSQISASSSQLTINGYGTSFKLTNADNKNKMPRNISLKAKFAPNSAFLVQSCMQLALSSLPGMKLSVVSDYSAEGKVVTILGCDLTQGGEPVLPSPAN